MKAEDILAVPLTKPGVLFNAPTTEAQKLLYRGLAKKWHPDVPTGDPKVFAHIESLYRAAQAMDKSLWDNGKMLYMTTSDGRQYRMHYGYSGCTDAGMYYTNSTKVVFIVGNDKSSLVESGINTMRNIHFNTEELSREMMRFLPQSPTRLKLKNHHAILINKTPDVVPLRQLVQLYTRIPPTQAAWMMGRLHNLCCGLASAGVVHNDISLDSVFVSIPYHNVLLLGGFWYSGKIGTRMNSVPARTYNILPDRVLKSKCHTISTSIALSKRTIIEALGGVSGVELRTNKEVPPEFVDWLLQPSSGNPYEDYEGWYKVLRTFYEDRFVKWEIPKSTIP